MCRPGEVLWFVKVNIGCNVVVRCCHGSESQRVVRELCCGSDVEVMRGIASEVNSEVSLWYRMVLFGIGMVSLLVRS